MNCAYNIVAPNSQHRFLGVSHSSQWSLSRVAPRSATNSGRVTSLDHHQPAKQAYYPFRQLLFSSFSLILIWRWLLMRRQWSRNSSGSSSRIYYSKRLIDNFVGRRVKIKAKVVRVQKRQSGCEWCCCGGEPGSNWLGAERRSASCGRETDIRSPTRKDKMERTSDSVE